MRYSTSVILIFSLGFFQSLVEGNVQVDYACLHNDSWLLNRNSNTNKAFNSLTEILYSSAYDSSWLVKFPGIVNYRHYMTLNDIYALNERPNAAIEFVGGKTSAVVGQYVDFGENIGYSSHFCRLGYWPPGPVCPTASDQSASFTLLPANELSSNMGCYTESGPVGLWVNGAAIFGFLDLSSYLLGKIWHNLASYFEALDVDICSGHAAIGVYHHHSYSACLAERLNETGDAHSIIWGWLSDGYPIYGPYQAAQTLATPCWQTRNYSDNITGCRNGLRTCTLVNQFDYTQGTTQLSSYYYGPNTTQWVTTLSQNRIKAKAGVYYEDYYYNSSCTAQGEQYLDAHNGHSHGDYGYHYHVTKTFPFTVGPTYYGCKTKCCLTIQDEDSSACTAQSICGTSLATPLTSSKCLPTYSPTTKPSTKPTAKPSITPTTKPTTKPTAKPSITPTTKPTTKPSTIPTSKPSKSTPKKSSKPSFVPTTKPFTKPSITPTTKPSTKPTTKPSSKLSSKPFTKSSFKP